jgi:hypothetical protein
MTELENETIFNCIKGFQLLIMTIQIKPWDPDHGREHHYQEKLIRAVVSAMKV